MIGTLEIAIRCAPILILVLLVLMEINVLKDKIDALAKSLDPQNGKDVKK